jgi:hypothetical protein
MLFATTENEFMVFPIQCSQSTLFDLIKQAKTAAYYVDTEPRELESNDEDAVIAKLMDATATPTAAEFEKVFFDWVNNSDSGALVLDNEYEFSSDEATVGELRITPNLTQAVFKRCFNSGDFDDKVLNIWPSGVIEHLLKKNIVSNQYVDGGILRSLCSRHDYVCQFIFLNNPLFLNSSNMHSGQHLWSCSM